MDQSRLRFEVFKGEVPGLVPGEVIIRDGDEFHGFRRVEGEDVHIYDLEHATGVRGDVAFDPRVLGLSDFLPANLTVKDCLWYHTGEALSVVGSDQIRGHDVWRVKSERDDGDVAEYWIEEPSFRVHRKTMSGAGYHIDVASEFSGGEPSWPFPSRVTARREAMPSGLERTYVVKNFEAPATISPDRFTLKSMDLPINTPAVDYRINRIVGYWNGEGLQEKPVRPKRMPAGKTPESQWGTRFVWCESALDARGGDAAHRFHAARADLGRF